MPMAQEILLKWTFQILITVLLLITMAIHNEATTVKAFEGELVEFNFTYPCDSTRVTLRYSYRPPFYSSANPWKMDLPPHHFLNDPNNSQVGQCSIQLTIDPVSRDNQGTYILTAYKNGQMLPDYPRIMLQVNYPPGKASCATQGEYTDEEWVSLQCTAPAGSQTGQIVCYQNGMRLPSLGRAAESSRTLKQRILARVAEPGPVYCCSCSLKDIKDICNCKDCQLHLIDNNAVTNITDPCPVTFTNQHPEPSKYTTERLINREYSTIPPWTDLPKEASNAIGINPCILYISTVIYFVSFIILLVIYILRIRQSKSISRELAELKNNCKCEQSHNSILLMKASLEQKDEIYV